MCFHGRGSQVEKEKVYLMPGLFWRPLAAVIFSLQFCSFGITFLYARNYSFVAKRLHRKK